MYETKNEMILMDPWMSKEGAFDSSWYQFPSNHKLGDEIRESISKTDKDVYIYISHDHKDHFDVPFLETLELSKIDEKTIDKWMKNKSAKRWQPFLKILRKRNPYLLDPLVEEILIEKSATGRSAWVRLFDETSAALRFPFRKDLLSEAEILNLLSDKDPENRKIAGKSLSDILDKNKRTFSIIGKVSDESAVFVEIDGISIPIKKNKFTFKGAISIGIKKYKVVAFDQWGNETTKNIFVERILLNDSANGFSEEEKVEYIRPFKNPGEDRRPTLTWPRQIPVSYTHLTLPTKA